MYRLGTLKQVVMGMILLTLTAGKMHASPEDERLRRIEIAHGWKIKSLAPRASLDVAFLAAASRGQSSEGWTDVGAMPATVHDILLRQGKIEDPWLPRGTEKCFWVGQQDWMYAVQFTLDKQGPEAWLRFKGIENKVDIYLNGEHLASHASKLPLVIQVNGRLHSENSLVLHCHADPSPGNGRRSDRGSYLGPNPAISSVGIFDSVFVEISDGHLLQEVVTDVSLDETLTRGTVTVDAVGSRDGVTVVSVKFDDEAVSDFFDTQVDLGRKPEQFARIWLHSHPSDSPEPSIIDDDTFARVFGNCEWAVLFVVAQDNKTYAKLNFNVGPGGQALIWGFRGSNLLTSMSLKKVTWQVRDIWKKISISSRWPQLCNYANESIPALKFI